MTFLLYCSRVYLIKWCPNYSILCINISVVLFCMQPCLYNVILFQCSFVHGGIIKHANIKLCVSVLVLLWNTLSLWYYFFVRCIILLAPNCPCCHPISYNVFLQVAFAVCKNILDAFLYHSALIHLWC